MDEVVTRSRCTACGRRLAFDDWKRGAEECTSCREPLAAAPPPAFSAPSRPRRAPPPPAARAGYRQHEQQLDDIPDELIDELVAALERETATRPSLAAGTAAPAPIGPALREFAEELGIGKDPRELTWAAWGFAAGFGANVILAKYVQMSTGASFTSFAVPLVLGGIAAGAASAGIAWGLTKLRPRA